MMLRKLALPLMLAAAGSAQAATITPLSMNYESDAFDTPPQAKHFDCSISLKPSLDIRTNKETFGATNFSPILSSPINAWVDAGLKNLSALGVQVLSGAQPESAKSISLQPSVSYSYLWYGPIRINATVVMDMEYTLPSGEKVQRAYRANGSKLNWANTDGELVTTLNYALNSVLVKIDQDLRSLCAKGQATVMSASEK